MTEVEREHVHNVYSQIAPHFSDTRFKPWPRIAQFLNDQPVGSIIADIGCGNGKYLGVNPQVIVIGSDICPELVSIARTRGHEMAVFDCLNLPYRSGVFDAAICIAVVHHLSTEERRLSALKELVRIVRPRGRILVYVWAMEQERKKFASQDVMVPWHLQPKYSGQSASVHKPKVADSAKAAAKREKKAAKLKKKFEKRGKNEKHSSNAYTATENAREDELNSEGKDVVDCLLGELPELSVEEGRETEKREGHNLLLRDKTTVRREVDSESTKPFHDHSSSTCSREDSCLFTDNDSTAASRTSETPDLVSLGYKTFQRYYHVFCRDELTNLFSRVEGVCVLEEFYDHENWCVLAEKESSDPSLK